MTNNDRSREIILDEWQEEILKAKGNVLLCTGRQVGKTTIFSRKAAERMVNQKGCQIITVSITEDQAKLIIVMVLDYLERHHKKLIKRGLDKPTQNKIHLTNGSSILARPVGTTGQAVRGFTGNVLYIDESSRMPELVWEASMPTLLTTGGDIWMSSTPFGKQGYFYECYLNKNDNYTVFHISSEEVIRNRPTNPSFPQEAKEKAIKFLEQQKEGMSEMQYGQEYLGLFLDELRTYFPDDLIYRQCTLKRPDSIKRGADYYIGVDIARMGGDESTFEIIRRTNNGKFVHVENITRTKILTTETEAIILELDRKYDFKKIYIDAGSGSLGVGIFDQFMKNDQVKRKVVPINNRAMSLDRDKTTKQRLLKEDLYDNLRRMLERNDLNLLDDEDVIASLRSVQFEYINTPSGLTKLRIFGDYTHIVEGLIRAAYCGKEKMLNMWVKSIRV